MAFDAIDNKPIGFILEGSPFGDEPFDGIYEYKFNPNAKTFVHNFDGYLYLCDVKKGATRRDIGINFYTRIC